jgi:hypothetical protein
LAAAFADESVGDVRELLLGLLGSIGVDLALRGGLVDLLGQRGDHRVHDAAGIDVVLGRHRGDGLAAPNLAGEVLRREADRGGRSLEREPGAVSAPALLGRAAGRARPTGPVRLRPRRASAGEEHTGDRDRDGCNELLHPGSLRERTRSANTTRMS